MYIYIKLFCKKFCNQKGCLFSQFVSPTLLTITHLWKNCWDMLKRIRQTPDHKDNNEREEASFHVMMGPRSVPS